MSFNCSDDSKSSFYAAIPNPCDKCRFTTCFSLHTSTTSSCPYKLCPECRELESLNAQIAEAHNVLVRLSQKRYKVKEQINRRHDQLTSRLPLEIISNIFDLIARELRSHKRSHKRSSRKGWSAVVLIGAVCKRWRDITLGTPQLWTKVVINPSKHASFPKIAEQWLSRSCALPLCLEVDTSEDKDLSSKPSSNPSDIFRLLRSQASRWQDLTLCLSAKLFRELLNGLEDRAPVDSLKISTHGPFIVRREKITMKYPLAPKTLHISYIPVPVLPVHWDRLTRLTANHIQADELLYIFRSAPNLQECILIIPPRARESGHYPIPVSPSIHESVTFLCTSKEEDNSTTPYFIRYLTLPSLEALAYNLTYTANREEIDVLADFLDRSQSPLDIFYLAFYDNGPPGPSNIDWYRSLSSLTSLDLNINSTDNGEKLQAYIKGLKADLVPMALPHLQELKISASLMNIETFDALAEMFPNKDTDTDNASSLPVVPRPLKKVTISVDFGWEDQEIMRQSTYRHLRKIRESGVRLVVYNKDKRDLLYRPDVDCLMFYEDDEDDSDERSTEESRSDEE